METFAKKALEPFAKRHWSQEARFPGAGPWTPGPRECEGSEADIRLQVAYYPRPHMRTGTSSSRHGPSSQTKSVVSAVKISQDISILSTTQGPSPCVVDTIEMSWEILSADTTDILSADTANVLSADTTYVLSATTAQDATKFY